MFNQIDAENIEKLNAGSGMKHRSTPYDMTNADDLAEAFLYSVAASMDYRRYWRELMQIEEEVDESFEVYDPAAWINMSVAPHRTDPLMTDAIGSLRETTDLFEELTERADNNLSFVLKTILSSPVDTQKAVLGSSYNIPDKELDGRIGELFDGLSEVDTHYNVQENRDEFLSMMKQLWAE